MAEDSGAAGEPAKRAEGPVGVVGLGQMGFAIAERLCDQNVPLIVWNRSSAKAAPLEQRGAEIAETPRAVAAKAAIVLSVVADDAALVAVTEGESGLLAGFRAQAGGEGLHVSMSTISPALARRLGESHRSAGYGYLGAPVFGRPPAARDGKLWIPLSGPAKLQARARPVLELISQGIVAYGDAPEQANVVKLGGNFMIMGAIESISEALTFAEKNGVDRVKAMEIYGKSLFNCPAYHIYGKMIAEQVYEPAGFPARLGLKDCNLVRAAALESQTPMPLSGLVHDRLLSLLAHGDGEIDWAGIGLAVARAAGTKD